MSEISIPPSKILNCWLVRAAACCVDVVRDCCLVTKRVLTLTMMAVSSDQHSTMCAPLLLRWCSHGVTGYQWSVQHCCQHEIQQPAHGRNHAIAFTTLYPILHSVLLSCVKSGQIQIQRSLLCSPGSNILCSSFTILCYSFSFLNNLSRGLLHSSVMTTKANKGVLSTNQNTLLSVNQPIRIQFSSIKK